MERTCALEAGTYATEFFVPQVTYTVPSAGWESLNRQAAPGNFHLFPPGSGSIEGFDSGTTDAITILSAAVAPGRCTGEPSAEFEPTFDGVVEFLTTNPRLRIRDVRDASVGGLDGTVMDIAFGEPDGCDDGDYTDFLVGVSPSHGPFGINDSCAACACTSFASTGVMRHSRSRSTTRRTAAATTATERTGSGLRRP